MSSSLAQCSASTVVVGRSSTHRSCSLPLRSCSKPAPATFRSSFVCGTRENAQRRQRLQAMPAQAAEEEEQEVPDGYLWYETMIILRPDLDEESRDLELAKFEAFLQKEGAVGIDVLVRPGSQQLAYPIKGYWDGIYVLYFYAASPKTAQGVQKLLTTPSVGSENNILRYMTFRQ